MNAEIIAQLNNLSGNVQSLKPLISKESLADFRIELEFAKNLTGLQCEIRARPYHVNPDNPQEVLYGVWLTDLKRENVILVHVRFPFIEDYQCADEWHRETFLKTKIFYQTDSRVKALFEKHLATYAEDICK